MTTIDRIQPSPENDKLYAPIDPTDPEIIRLAESIRRIGLKERIVITEDGYIISGHRRFAACKLAKIRHVSIRVEPFRREDDPDRFLRLLREYNLQRDKSIAEKLREAAVDLDPAECWDRLLEQRRQSAEISAETITIHGTKHRSAITDAKKPFLDAIRTVIEEMRSFWPLSLRQVHYKLLNKRPRMHASKSGSRYQNNIRCYKSLSELCTRARLTGEIPFSAIDDETRPCNYIRGFGSAGSFIRQQTDNFLCGYHRDLMRSQPNHVEVLVEKNTVRGIAEQITEKYTIPLTSGRGYSSLPPRKAIVDRFRQSGKEKLIVIVLSDFDPEGLDIAHPFARCMRDDFSLDIQVVRAGLTPEQVAELDDPPAALDAKKSSSRYERFVAEHGTDCFELEAIPPENLQRILQAAIDDVIDVDLLNAELDQEKLDARHIEAASMAFRDVLLTLDVEVDDDGEDDE